MKHVQAWWRRGACASCAVHESPPPGRLGGAPVRGVFLGVSGASHCAPHLLSLPPAMLESLPAEMPSQTNCSGGGPRRCLLGFSHRTTRTRQHVHASAIPSAAAILRSRLPSLAGQPELPCAHSSSTSPPAQLPCAQQQPNRVPLPSAQHIAFWDRDTDGLITPADVYVGFRCGATPGAPGSLMPNANTSLAQQAIPVTAAPACAGGWGACSAHPCTCLGASPADTLRALPLVVAAGAWAPKCPCPAPFGLPSRPFFACVHPLQAPGLQRVPVRHCAAHHQRHLQ